VEDLPSSDLWLLVTVPPCDLARAVDNRLDGAIHGRNRPTIAL
jgi:hypothetical protein